MWAGPLVCVAAGETVLHHPVLTGKAQFGSAVSRLCSPNEPSSLLICTEAAVTVEPSARSGSTLLLAGEQELLTASSRPKKKRFYCFTLLQMEQQNKEMMD